MNPRHRFQVIGSPDVSSLQLPPQNLECEVGVLGGMIHDNANIDEITVFLKAEDFYRDSHQAIFKAILALRDSGSPVDARLLSEQLQRSGEWEKIGGIDTLTQILENTIPVNAVFHGQVVKDRSTARNLLAMANQVTRDVHSNQFTPDELITRADQALFTIADQGSRMEVSDLQAGLDEDDAIHERRRSGNPGGILSGFTDLDDLLDGLQPGSLTIIAGRPSMGKSALAHNIIDNVAIDQGITPFLVSMEMTKRDVALRMKQGRALIDSYRIKKPWTLLEDEKDRLAEAVNTLRAHNFPIDDNSSRTVVQIGAVARRQRIRREIGILVIDHIQLTEADPDTEGSSRQEQIAKVSRKLKILARELSIPVVALSQLNRLSEGRQDRRPVMSDLRESGAIEQDADVVILVHRPEYYDPNDSPGTAEIIVAKNRNGGTGMTRLAFQRQFARFDNLETHTSEF